LKTILACIAAICSIINISNNKKEIYSGAVTFTNKDTTPVFQMKQYWLTFLYKGPNRNHDSVTAARIQKAHIKNIERLAAEGKIVMAGPMGYDKDLRGIFIIDAKDSIEAASYINTDSAIIIGRLRFEVHPWWTAKGKYEFK
jgi:uncharacterized protein YciI